MPWTACSKSACKPPHTVCFMQAWHRCFALIRLQKCARMKLRCSMSPRLTSRSAMQPGQMLSAAGYLSFCLGKQLGRGLLTPAQVPARLGLHTNGRNDRATAMQGTTRRSTPRSTYSLASGPSYRRGPMSTMPGSRPRSLRWRRRNSFYHPEMAALLTFRAMSCLVSHSALGSSLNLFNVHVKF